MKNDFLIEDIHIAIDYLSQGEILISGKGKEITFFAKKNDKILCQSKAVVYRLSVNEFVNLFKESKFKIYSINEEEGIDLLKDEEYYRWNVLKK